MAQLDDLIKGWVPEFGNEHHIQAVKDIGLWRKMQKRGVNSKKAKARMLELERQITFCTQQTMLK